jgi:DNA modification methylase
MSGLLPVTIPAMSCCLGLEDSIEAYVGHMVLVFRELWRVLRDDGVAWLNLGDSYASQGGPQIDGTMQRAGSQKGAWRGKSRNGFNNLPAKNLLGIPWRVAFALQADGWYLRSDVIWAKKNGLPESCKDRPTKAHEYLFLLAKSDRYYYDQEAIREPLTDSSIQRLNQPNFDNQTGGPKDYRNGTNTNRSARNTLENLKKSNKQGRNRRTVWSIATRPYKEAHFAVMPAALIEPCILAGCPSRVCAECGEPWVRVVEKTGKSLPVSERHGRTGHNGQPPQISGNYWEGPTTKSTNTFTPTCTCNGYFEDKSITDYYDWEETDEAKKEIIKVYVPNIPLSNHPHRPGIVLDPFFGSGTTGEVAIKNKRGWLGIELNPEYVELAEKRIGRTQPALFAV